MEKILTIIIPTYNMEKYLDKCLTSLIIEDKELMNRLEVLVIIDGAKDRSSEIAHTYQDRYPDTFIVIDKENGNYGSCINRGLKEASGKYVKVLDADDSFETSSFELYLRHILSVDADLIISNYCIVNENGKITSTQDYNLPEKNVFNFDLSIAKILVKKNLQMHAIAYKTLNLRNINYKQTEGISYTDQEWTYTPMQTVNKISYFKPVLYRYLVGRVGQTMDPNVLKKTIRQNEICVLRKLRDYTASTPNSYAIEYYLTKMAYVSLYIVYRHYLLAYKDSDLEDLKSFEKELYAIDSKLLKMSDELKLNGTNYHYVKKWHQNGDRPGGLIFNTCLFLHHVFNYLSFYL